MKRYLAIVTLLLLSFLLSPVYTPTSTCSAAKKFNFYFYYPDSILTNLGQLAYAVDIFFMEGDAEVYFQAFHHKVDFDRMFKVTQPSLVLLPEWYYRDYRNVLDVTPIMTPTRNGKTEYTKVLVVNKRKPFELDELAGRVLAMTPMGQHAVEHLNNDLFPGRDIAFSACEIIPVGKDADALYALLIGQVDAAVVSAGTITTVVEMNKHMGKLIKVLAESQPVPMPLLCVLNADKEQEDVKRVTEFIFEQGGQQALPEVMEILDLDGWQKISY